MKDEIVAQRGVTEVLRWLNKPLKEGEGLTTASFNAIRNAAKLHEAILDISPSVTGGQYSAELLWGLREKLIMVVASDTKGPEQSFEAYTLNTLNGIKLLENAGLVFFKELSVHDPRSSNADEKGTRAQNPMKLWELWARVADTDRDPKGRSIFEFWKREAPKSDAPEDVQREYRRYKENEGKYSRASSSAFDAVRTYVRKISVDFTKNNFFWNKVDPKERPRMVTAMNSLANRPKSFQKSARAFHRESGHPLVSLLGGLWDQIAG